MSKAGSRFQKIRRRHKLLGLLRLFRIPNLLLILLGQLLVLWKFPLTGNFSGLLLQPSVLLGMLASQFAAAAGYILNDYHDVKIDSINKPGRVVVGRLVTRRKALVAYFGLNLLAVGAGFLAGRQAGLLVLFCCFLLWMYSAKMKCIPLAGNLLVALLVAVSLYLPSLFFKASLSSLWLFCLFAFISNFIRELVKDLEDMRGDRQHHCRTFPIAYGIPASRHLINGAGILLLLTMLVMVTESPLAGLLILILCAVPFAIFFFRIQKADKKKDFTRLSRILKWAMLAGIAGMMAF